MSADNEMFDWYQDYYTIVERSTAYSKYCKKVFGQDFSQQGFSNKDQISAMLRLLDIRPKSRILDIGCGNGKLTEYISDSTDSTAYGFDYSTAAIGSACSRTVEKKEKLVFEVGSIGVKQYPDESFDAVIAIDTIFFAKDMCQTIKDIYRWLKPNGKMAIFYSEFRFDENEPLEKMLPDHTGMAKVFADAGVRYTVYDFTENHYHHMKLKRRIALELKKEFEEEGTMVLFNNISTESIDEREDFDTFRQFSTRYLYIAEKIYNCVQTHSMLK